MNNRLLSLTVSGLLLLSGSAVSASDTHSTARFPEKPKTIELRQEIAPLFPANDVAPATPSTPRPSSKIQTGPEVRPLASQDENLKPKGDDKPKKKKERIGEPLDAVSVILIVANFVTMAGSMMMFALGIPLAGIGLGVLFLAIFIFSILKSNKSESERRERLKKRAKGEDKEDRKKEREERKEEKSKDKGKKEEKKNDNSDDE